jgi:hypothetical protein
LPGKRGNCRNHHDSSAQREHSSHQNTLTP